MESVIQAINVAIKLDFVWSLFDCSVWGWFDESFFLPMIHLFHKKIADSVARKDHSPHSYFTSCRSDSLLHGKKDIHNPVNI